MAAKRVRMESDRAIKAHGIEPIPGVAPSGGAVAAVRGLEVIHVDMVRMVRFAVSIILNIADIPFLDIARCDLEQIVSLRGEPPIVDGSASELDHLRIHRSFVKQQRLQIARSQRIERRQSGRRGGSPGHFHRRDHVVVVVDQIVSSRR